MRTDTFNGTGIVEDIAYSKTVSGSQFIGTTTGTIGANTTAYSLFRTAGTQEPNIHAFLAFSSTGAGVITVFEAPTLSTTTGLISKTIINNNRVSAHTTGCQLFVVPTSIVSSAGSTIFTLIVPQATAGSDLLKTGMILKNAETYLAQFQNGNGANTSNVSMNIYFFCTEAH